MVLSEERLKKAHFKPSLTSRLSSTISECLEYFKMVEAEQS